MDADLVKIALIGTARLGNVTLPPLPVDELFLGSSRSLEEQILLRAGTLAIYQQAGRVLPKSPAPKPAPVESVPGDSAKLITTLRHAFAADAHDLLTEFCSVMKAHNIRLPHGLLPQALSLSTPSLRMLIRPLLGEHGLWLSQFRPDWNWVQWGETCLPASELLRVQRQFAEGSLGERCAALQEWRKCEPARAREALAVGFKQESAANRAQLLQQLETNLTLADEAFLNDALRVRAESVRTTAAGLLSQLRGSKLLKRMEVRADEMLTIDRSGNGVVLRCATPDELPKDWAADGIPAGREQLVTTVLTCFSPQRWCEQWELSPQQLVEAAATQPLATALVAGWQAGWLRWGTGEQPAAEWIEALLQFWKPRINHEQESCREQSWCACGQLLTQVPVADRERWLRELFKTARDPSEPEASKLWWLLPAPWSQEFSTWFIAFQRKTMNRRDLPVGGDWLSLMGKAVGRLHPAAFPGVVADLTSRLMSGNSRSQSQALQRFLLLINLRQSFHDEILALRRALQVAPGTPDVT